MRVSLVILTLAVIARYQTGTTDYLSYMPLQIGNRWQYEAFDWYGDSTWSIGYHISYVVGDTVAPNGKRYFVFQGASFGTLVRIDTSEQILYVYDEWSECPQNEWDFIRFSAIDSLGWIPCSGGSADIFPDTVYFELLNKSVASLTVEHGGPDNGDRKWISLPGPHSAFK